MATHFKEDALLDKLGGIALNADAVSWLLKPKDFKQALLTKIASATSSIYIAALYVEDDEAGREVLQALLDAKKPKPTIRYQSVS